MTTEYRPAFKSPGLQLLEEFLVAEGFVPYTQPGDDRLGVKVLWQRRLEGVEPVCRLNDKLNLNVWLSEVELPGHPLKRFAGAEVELCAELPDTQWAKLMVYSVPPEALPRRFELIRTKLVKAWQAMAELSTALAPGQEQQA